MAPAVNAVLCFATTQCQQIGFTAHEQVWIGNRSRSGVVFFRILTELPIQHHNQYQDVVITTKKTIHPLPVTAHFLPNFPQCVCVCVCEVSHSVVSDSLGSHGLQPTRLLCPWNSPGKNTGVGSHALLQGILPTQGSNLHLLHGRWIFFFFFTTEPPGKPLPTTGHV